MTSLWFDLSPTLKTLNLSLLRFLNGLDFKIMSVNDNAIDDLYPLWVVVCLFYFGYTRNAHCIEVCIVICCWTNMFFV